MKQLLLRLFSRKKIAKCDDFGALSGSVLGIDPPPVPDVDKLLRGLSGSRENGTRETTFLEFKAHYLPKAEDSSTVDACKWNVVEAMISMANAWGGCILLGVREDKERKELKLVDIGYEAFLAANRESRDFCAHVRKELLGSQGAERLVFEVSDTKRYELEGKHLEQLRKCVSFYLCDSKRLNGTILAILVSHVEQMEELIAVSSIRKEKKMFGLRETQKALLFYRNSKSPDTAQKDWTDIGAYYSARESSKPDFSQVAKNLMFSIDGQRVHRWTRHFEEICMLLLLLLAVSIVVGLSITPGAGSYLMCFVLVVVVALIALGTIGYILRHRLAPLNSLLLDVTVQLNKRELDVELWRIVTENKNVKSRWRYCYEVHLRWADSLEDAPFRVQQLFVYDRLDRGMRRGSIGIETIDLNGDGYEDLALLWRRRKKPIAGKPDFWAKTVFLYDPKTQDLDLSSPVCKVSEDVVKYYTTCADIPKKEFMLGYFPVGNRMVPLAKGLENASATASGPAAS